MSTFPVESDVTIVVACGGATGSSGRHKVTIHPDWTIETGHDLELERIASAFGSKISCVDLVDRRLPCVEQLWLHSRRLAPPGILRSPEGRWALASRVSGCACDDGERVWKGPVEASAHLRSASHWARAFGADLATCNRLVKSIERATGASFDGVHHAPWPRSGAVAFHTDFAWLWDVGLCPDEVERIHAGLGLTEPLPSIAYLYVASSGAPLEALRPYVSNGADAVCWAASSWVQHGEVEPSVRWEWYVSGLNWRLITALIAGPYALSDVRELAVRTSTSLNRAADVLVDWRALHCRPDVDDIVRVRRLNPHGRQVPTPAALSLVLRSNPGSKLTRLDAALILACVGTVPDASALIRKGVVTLSDLEILWVDERRIG